MIPAIRIERAGEMAVVPGAVVSAADARPVVVPGAPEEVGESAVAVAGGRVDLRASLEAGPLGADGPGRAFFRWKIEGPAARMGDTSASSSRTNPREGSDLRGAVVAFTWGAAGDYSVRVTAENDEGEAVSRTVRFEVLRPAMTDPRTASAAVESVVAQHARWQDGFDAASFLDAHRGFLDQVRGPDDALVGGPSKASLQAPPPRPRYFQRSPGPPSWDSEEAAAALEPRLGLWHSPRHGYVRLGEYQTRAELEADLAFPYHAIGLRVLAMRSPRLATRLAPLARGRQFWRWLDHLEGIVEAWESDGPDVAEVEAVVPKDGSHPAGVEEVWVAFDRPVSSPASRRPAWGPTAVGVEAARLLVGGQAATRVDTVDPGRGRDRVFRFSGFPAPPAGEVEIRLEGASGYEGRIWTVAVGLVSDGGSVSEVGSVSETRPETVVAAESVVAAGHRSPSRISPCGRWGCPVVGPPRPRMRWRLRRTPCL